uniref:Uncharacterized protein n=1 Tax=Ralstonia solanacearum TaxID=305 RepID=A0A0S4W506_RALSL|nr:protein of unknown function [Ralstonia solanacearum]CUV34554.1 protein of unknown function [Ralstonia solanacearum]CUV41900.1 protein of unknown function [Ralstonia solanacearum]CUV59275.1 protein of unknown function [Ralstonia solanacearum]
MTLPEPGIFHGVTLTVASIFHNQMWINPNRKTGNKK